MKRTPKPAPFRPPYRTGVDLRDSSHLPPADLTEQLHELRREQALRSSVYPALIRTGKLTERAAVQQNHRLAAAIATLESDLQAERDLALIQAGIAGAEQPAIHERCSCPYCPRE